MTLTAPPAGWYRGRVDPDELRYWDGNGWTDDRRRVPQPGWYPHPQDPNGVRYWNGSAWTDQTAPVPAPAGLQPAPTAPPPTPTLPAPPATPVAEPWAPEPAALTPTTPTPSTAPIAPSWSPEPAAAAPTPAVATSPTSPVAAPWASEPAAPLPVRTVPAPLSTPVAPPWAPETSEPAPGATPAGKEGPAEAVAKFRAAPALPPDGTAEAVAKLRATPTSQTDAAPGEKPHRSRVLIVIEALVLLAVVAVGGYLLLTKSGLSLGGSSAPAPVQAPAGYRVASVPSAGLEFAVPSAWLGVDPSSPTVQQDLQRVAAQNPQLSGFAASTSNIKYLAVETSNPIYNSNVEVLNLGVTKAALSNAVAVQSAFRNEIPNATAVATTIAGTRGLSLTGTVPVTLSNGAHITVHATAYILGTSKGVYTLIFGTTDDATQDVNVQTALRTLQLLP